MFTDGWRDGLIDRLKDEPIPIVPLNNIGGQQ